MGRWEPETRARLRLAAIELWQEKGFDETSAAEIADRAGVTERTFFRHFVDKREVLFQGQEELEERFTTGIIEAPAEASALEVVAFALGRVAPFFGQERQPYSTLRRQIIEANTPLMEREQFKMLTLTSAVSKAFRERGVGEPDATLSAHSALAIFNVAFTMWTTPDESRTYDELVGVALTSLRQLVASDG